MLHVAHPKIVVRPRRTIAPVALPRAAARSTRAESIAAPLTLAAVVVGALLFAAATAVLGALGA